MSGVSVASIITGPALISYRGQTFRSKADIVMENSLSTFGITTGVFSEVDRRVSERNVTLRFEPDGEWSSLGVLFPYVSLGAAGQIPFGDFINPTRTFLYVNTGNYEIQMNNHNLTSGDSVLIVGIQGETLPAPLVGNTIYYVHVVDPNFIQLCTTYANAITGTSPVQVSSQGSGLTRLVVNNPLQIQSQDGYLYSFYNAAVVRMPGISASTVKTLLKEVEFEAFIADGYDWTNVTPSPYYTVSQNPWPGDPGFNPQNILTQPIVASWGATSPWSNIFTKDGWEVDFELGLQAVTVDNIGTITRKLSSLRVTAKATPIGVNTNDVFNALLMQGAGAQRGRSLNASSNNLNLSTAPNNFYVRIYNAALEGGPQQFSLTQDRVGRLTWTATRQLNSVNEWQPLAYVGSALIT